MQKIVMAIKNMRKHFMRPNIDPVGLHAQISSNILISYGNQTLGLYNRSR